MLDLFNVIGATLTNVLYALLADIAIKCVEDMEILVLNEWPRYLQDCEINEKMVF